MSPVASKRPHGGSVTIEVTAGPFAVGRSRKSRCVTRIADRWARHRGSKRHGCRTAVVQPEQRTPRSRHANPRAPLPAKGSSTTSSAVRGTTRAMAAASSGRRAPRAGRRTPGVSLVAMTVWGAPRRRMTQNSIPPPRASQRSRLHADRRSSRRPASTELVGPNRPSSNTRNRKNPRTGSPAVGGLQRSPSPESPTPGAT
jgi:hypothetical protein